MTKQLPTSSRLKEIMEYRDGVLYWKPNRNGCIVTKPAGSKLPNGYISIKVDGVPYKAHRLVWAWHYNETPKMLDHINGIKDDNRIENLRICNDSENARNKTKYKTNSTGYANVVWNKNNNNYNVQISVNKKRLHIGAFNDLELAALVAEEARSKYFGNFARKGI